MPRKSPRTTKDDISSLQQEMKPLADKIHDVAHSQPKVFNGPALGKIRILKTVSIFANFVLMAASAQTSAALVDLAHHFSVTLASVSIIITVNVLSHMGGTWVGGVLYSHVNVFAMLSIATLGYCLTLATCVFMPNVFVFFAVSAIGAACNGAIDSVANSHLLAIWDGERLRDSLMQGMHASWSAGAMLMGATLNNFLNPDLQASRNATSDDYYSNTSTTYSTLPLLVSTNSSSPSPSVAPTPSSGRVQYAYVLFACLGLFPFCLNVFLYTWDRRMLSRGRHPSEAVVGNNSNDGAAKPSVENSGGRLTGMRALVMVVFAVVACVFDVERFTSTFLSSYLHYGLDWSTPSASVAFSVFYGGQFSARLLSVVISAFVRPIYILLTNGSLILVSVVILGIFGKADVVPYITSFMMGVGNSCSFPSLYLWLSSFTPITGLVSASLFLGNLDSLLSPVFSHLIENWWAPFFICYAITLCFVCICTLIIGHRVGLRLLASLDKAEAAAAAADAKSDAEAVVGGEAFDEEEKSRHEAFG